MNKKYHLMSYLNLFAILAIGFYCFVFFSYDRNIQTSVVVSVAIAYVGWGTVQHIIRKDMHILIFLEYLTVASLGLLIVLSMLASI